MSCSARHKGVADKLANTTGVPAEMGGEQPRCRKCGQYLSTAGKAHSCPPLAASADWSTPGQVEQSYQQMAAEAQCRLKTGAAQAEVGRACREILNQLGGQAVVALAYWQGFAYPTMVSEDSLRFWLNPAYQGDPKAMQVQQAAFKRWRKLGQPEQIRVWQEERALLRQAGAISFASAQEGRLDLVRQDDFPHSRYGEAARKAANILAQSWDKELNRKIPLDVLLEEAEETCTYMQDAANVVAENWPDEDNPAYPAHLDLSTPLEINIVGADKRLIHQHRFGNDAAGRAADRAMKELGRQWATRDVPERVGGDVGQTVSELKHWTARLYVGTWQYEVGPTTSDEKIAFLAGLLREAERQTGLPTMYVLDGPQIDSDHPEVQIRLYGLEGDVSREPEWTNDDEIAAASSAQVVRLGKRLYRGEGPNRRELWFDQGSGLFRVGPTGAPEAEYTSYREAILALTGKT